LFNNALHKMYIITVLKKVTVFNIYSTGYSVTVISDPPVYGNTSIFEYTAGSNITLTCMVTPTPPSDTKFSWCSMVL